MTNDKLHADTKLAKHIFTDENNQSQPRGQTGRPHLDLEAGVVAADDVVDNAVLLGLQRRHVPVTVRVLLDLHIARAF